eukprot:5285799-Prymnesium_polylepis.1
MDIWLIVWPRTEQRRGRAAGALPPAGATRPCHPVRTSSQNSGLRCRSVTGRATSTCPKHRRRAPRQPLEAAAWGAYDSRPGVSRRCRAERAAKASG